MMRWVAAVFFFPQDPPQKHLEKAIDLTHQEKWSEAVPLLRAYLRAKPDDAAAWALLGLCHNRRKEWQSARDALEIARGLEPWRKRYARELGVAYNGLLEWEKAEAQLREALAVYPNDPAVLIPLGIALLKQRKSADARSQFEKLEKGNLFWFPLSRLLILQTRVQEGDLKQAREESKALSEDFALTPLEERGRRIPVPGRPAQRFQIRGQFSVEYDDNIFFLGADVPRPAFLSAQGDTRFVQLLSAVVELLRETEWSLGVGDTIYGSSHVRDPEANFLSNRAFGTLAWVPGEDWAVSLESGYRFDRLAAEEYREALDGSVTARAALGDEWWLDFGAGIANHLFRVPSATEETDRDGIEFSGRASVSTRCPALSARIQAGAVYRQVEAEGDDYDGSAIELFARWNSPLVGDLTLSVFAEYAYEWYDNKNSLSGFVEERRDSRVTGQVSLRYPIYPNLSAMAFYRKTRAMSNIDFYDADQNVFGLGIEYWASWN